VEILTLPPSLEGRAHFDKRAPRLIATLGVFLSLLVTTMGGEISETANEYEVKAAFLYKFASFVEWPAEAQSSTLCIGVVGQDPFGSMLDRVVKGKSINGRNFAIRRYKSAKEAAACQIVFVSSSERTRLHTILEYLRRSSVLTVSDIPGFCQNGGMIDFEILDQKVRFAINPEAAEQAHLKLSSKLMSVAVFVCQGGQ
jgi:hypothetical protein